MKLSYLAGCQSIQAHLEDAPCKNKNLEMECQYPLPSCESSELGLLVSSLLFSSQQWLAHPYA